MTDATLLDHEYALEWCSKNLLMEADFFPDLVPALCHTFSKDEEELQLLVRNKFQDKDDFTWATVLHWVECSNLSSAQFLTMFSTCGALVDGLFLWLASVILKTHCNFVHEDAIWTL